MLRLRRLEEYLRQSLWFVPSLLLAGFVVLAVAAAYADRNILAAQGTSSLYGGSAEGARAILATIATAMLSLAALVFSITLVVLQLASSQLTPRILHLFLQDRGSKIAMGVFLGTFAYALAGLWFIRAPSETNAAFVPVLTVSLAFLAVGVSLATFLNYINRVAHSIRLETIASEISRQVHESIDSDPGFTGDADDAESPAGEAEYLAKSVAGYPTRLIAASQSGTVIGISTDVCEQWADENGAVVEILVPLGRFVTEGMPVVRVHGIDTGAEFPLESAVSLGAQRVIALDPAYGVHELVDIAVRALSPGVNEPAMAAVVLDHIHDILERVGHSSMSGTVSRNAEGEPMVIVPQLTWDGWVSLALREVIDYGGDSVQVCRRVMRMLEDLLASLPEIRHSALRRYLNEVSALPASSRPYLEWSEAPADERSRG